MIPYTTIYTNKKEYPFIYIIFIQRFGIYIPTAKYFEYGVINIKSGM